MNPPLNDLIMRYTPALLDAVVASRPEEIAGLEARVGMLPESYRDFLQWMGNACPILDSEELHYTPRALLEFQADETVPAGYLLIGIDNSDASLDVHIRLEDGVIVCFTEDFEPVTEKKLLLENLSLSSLLLTTYLRNILVPSHPLHFSAAFKGDTAQITELWRRMDEACGHQQASALIQIPDLRLYGGDGFVLGAHQRPASSIVTLHFGAFERVQLEAWSDLVLARWRFLRMPEP